MPRDDAALARNWWTILLLDNAFGVGLLLLGLSAGGVGGAILVTIACAYLFFSIGRIVKWRRIRRQAGLS